MHQSVTKWHPLFWPLLVSFCISGFYLVIIPNQLEKDALNYDEMAHSILVERRVALDGELTMKREPGYPVLRAALYLLGSDQDGIRLFQVLLSVAAIWITAVTARIYSERLSIWVAWFSSIYYGYAVYSAYHLSEAFTAFLVAIFGYLLLCLAESKNVKTLLIFSALAGLTAGVLGLTRAAFQFIGIFMLFPILFLLKSYPLKIRMTSAALLIVTSIVIIMPWMMRNKIYFDEFAITQRAGAVLEARAFKAEQSWSALGASYASVFIGQANVEKFLESRPIVRDQQWESTWRLYLNLIDDGYRPHEADSILFEKAKMTIFSDPQIFLRYILWTPIDTLRLLMLSSPGTPNFSIEGMFVGIQRNTGISAMHMLAILFFEFVNAVWLIGTLIGLGIGFYLHRWRFVAGWLLIYMMLVHAPFDLIERYSIPLIPWRMFAFSLFFMWVLDFFMKNRVKQ